MHVWYSFFIFFLFSIFFFISHKQCYFFFLSLLPHSQVFFYLLFLIFFVVPLEIHWKKTRPHLSWYFPHYVFMLDITWTHLLFEPLLFEESIFLHSWDCVHILIYSKMCLQIYICVYACVFIYLDYDYKLYSALLAISIQCVFI